MQQEIEILCNKMSVRTLPMMDRYVIVWSILNQTPMLRHRSATGRRYSQTNLSASMRRLTTLFMSANSGASGNVATNIVMKPYCTTETERRTQTVITIIAAIKSI